MIKVYVAGAYSDDTELGVMRNVGRGEHYAAELLLKGYAPFAPWLDRNLVVRLWDKQLTLETLYKCGIEWLRVSDCMFVVPNHEGLRDWNDSVGTIGEIEEARKHRIPVFHSLGELYRKFPVR